MRPDHTSPRSPSENTIRPDAPHPDGMTPNSNPGNASNVRLDPKLAQCWTSVYDVVPTSNQHKLYVLRLLIIHIYKYVCIYAWAWAKTHTYMPMYVCMYKAKFTKLFKIVEIFFLIINIASSDILFIVIYTKKNHDYDLI